jgi:hypothetical protein
MADNSAFHRSLLQAGMEYQRTKDLAQYLANCGQTALEASLRGYPKTAMAVTAAQWFIKGLIVQQVESIRKQPGTFELGCPVRRNQSAIEFLTDLAEHVKRQRDRTLDPLRDALRHLGLMKQGE